MKKIVIYFLFLCFLSVYAFAENMPKYFSRHYTGKIGDMEIVMELNKIDSMLTGNYYYIKMGTPITFINYTSVVKDGINFYIEENGGTNDNGEIITTGIFTGTLDAEKFSGTWSNPKNNKTLSFDLKEDYADGTVKLKYENGNKNWGESSYGGSKVTVECAYPQIESNLSQNIADKINTSIKNDIQFADGEKSKKSLEDYFNVLVEDFKGQEENKDNKEVEEEKAPWVCSIHASIQRNSDNVLCVQYETYSNTGGAHPNYSLINSNYDLKTGEKIKLENIINIKKIDKVDEIAEKLFRLQYNLNPSANWEDMGYTFENGIFKLNENFIISKDALLFIYNPYEIGAYAMGSSHLTVPFKEISKYLIGQWEK